MCVDVDDGVDEPVTDAGGEDEVADGPAQVMLMLSGAGGRCRWRCVVGRRDARCSGLCRCCPGVVRMSASSRGDDVMSGCRRSRCSGFC